jgi:hypothetical protein
MSMEAFRWALTWNGLTSSEKFVLVMIADHYNDRAHRAWPSIARLANFTALNRTTVMRALKGLEEKGLIETEPWVRAEAGGPLNNRYCLPLFDPRSRRAAHLPVIATKAFNNDGTVEFDTFPHQFEHGEEVPGYVA